MLMNFFGGAECVTGDKRLASDGDQITMQIREFLKRILTVVEYGSTLL